MRLPEGVEWSLHCTWLLTFARDGDALPARRLAEFYGLPEAYLAKLLKGLVRAGLLSSTSGPRGGFRRIAPGGRQHCGVRQPSRGWAVPQENRHAEFERKRHQS